MPGFLQKIFGSHNDRVIKGILPIVERVNALEPALSKLSDADLRARTGELRTRIENGAPLDEVLPDAFATVREATKRTIGQRQYDVQLIGGVVLHRGGIAEMRTGEGKTLVGHAARLSQRARREGRPHRHRQRLPGAPRRRVDGPDPPLPRLSVGVILHDLDDARRRAAPTRATSPTSPTTSSASTTCATT